MELPKNIVQIGRPDKIHKIFVEDYVVSYIKQLNRACEGRASGLALYGRKYEEEGCHYYFLYGASVVAGLEHRGPYLSQVEKEEIAAIGKRYFEEYDFLAWCNVKEEPVDGFYVTVQGKGVEVNGYACFYEKNESMLNYMLMLSRQEKKEEPAVEEAAAVKPARGEWKAADYMKAAERQTHIQQPKNRALKKTEYMKMAVAAMFLGLCVIGITTLNDYEKLEDLQVAARQVIASLTEQKLPDAALDSTEDARIQPDVGDMTVPPGENGVTVQPGIGEGTSAGQVSGNAAQTEPEVQTAGSVEQTDSEVVQIPEVALPVSYTIVKGDTLISICMKKYGSLDKLQEICEINAISNPDSIAVGQTILLPQ